MSRLKVMFSVATLLVAVVAGVALWGRDAAACWRRSAPCCPPPCIQYVYIERDKPPAPNPKSFRVQSLFILDTETARTANEVGAAALEMTDMLNQLPPQFRGEPTKNIRGKNLEKDKVLQAVRDMEVGPNETLLVYCNVHGGVVQAKSDKSAPTPKPGASDEPAAPASASTEEKDQILYMNGSAPEDQRELKRSDLMAAIQAKDARLKILISDSCFVPGKEEEEAFPSTGVHIKTKEVLPPREHLKPTGYLPEVLTDLLVNHKGVLNINSAKPGQESVFGVFVPTLIEHCNGSYSPAKWPDFFDDLGKDVPAAFKEVLAKYGDSPEKEHLLKVQKTQTVWNFARDEHGQPLFPEYTPTAEREAEQGGEAETAAPAAAAAEDEDKSYAVPAPDDEKPAGDDSSAGPASSATIVVSLPAGARLFFDGQPTVQTSARRVFQSPELRPGKEYIYTLRAEMPGAAGAVTESREVTVRAGGQTEVRFDPNNPLTTQTGVADRPGGRDGDLTHR